MPMRLATLAAAAVLTLAVTAHADDSKPTTLTIKLDGKAAGTLKFFAAGTTSNTFAKGAAGDKLKAEWAKLSAQKTLPLQWEERTKEKGFVMSTRQVAPADANYPFAVEESLKRDGFESSRD
jgi:hypothetical protein